MRVWLLAVSFFLSLICINAFAQRQRCFERSFSTGIKTVETKKNSFDETIMFVNAGLPMMRFDIRQYQAAPANNFTNVSVYMDYKAKKRYVYFVQTGLCTEEPISMRFQPFCIALNAVFVGTDVIGGKLKVDTYEESTDGSKKRISYAQDTNVPVSVVTMRGPDVTVENFVSWVNQTPDVSLFTIPSACKKMNKMKKSKDNVNTKSVIEKVNKILRRSI
ncbi:hypothetical protein ABK040_013612 [Willaertia magna]